MASFLWVGVSPSAKSPVKILRAFLFREKYYLCCMTTEKITLNVGDKLYYFQYGMIGHTITIDRVTDKTAWSDRTKFKREQGYNHFIRPIGSGSYSGHYRLENPELLAEYGLKLKRRKAIQGFEKLAKACQSADEETLNKYLQFIESL